MESCPVVQSGISSLFTQPFFQVGHCLIVSITSEFPLLMHHHKPSLVMMELTGDGGTVLMALRKIHQFLTTWSSTPLLISTHLQDARLLQQLVTMGVFGIYLKQDSLLALTHCIKQVMNGQRGFSPQASTLIASNMNRPSQLTYREIDVLEYLFKGKSVTDTAMSLHRNVRTISTHKRNVMNKLGLHSDCELYAWGAGLSRDGATA